MKSLPNDWEVGSLKTDLTASDDFTIEALRDYYKIIDINYIRYQLYCFYQISDILSDIRHINHPAEQTWQNRHHAPGSIFQSRWL